MKNNIIMTFIVLVIFSSCSEMIVRRDNDENWLIAGGESIALHYRPPGFSDSASPSLEQAEEIANNQLVYYHAIQDSIGAGFSDKVMIYLYNYDEAKAKIGTNGGGHALPKYNCYYYTFIDSNKSITDQFGIEDPYIGAHELVHVISHRTLGYPGTKLLSEGYAVWLDGTYARYHIDEIMIHYRDDAPEKILTPDQLLDEAYDHPAAIYYPNCGIFTRYLVDTYEVGFINTLFTVNEENFIPRFEELCGDSWDSLSVAYSLYLDNL